MVSKKRLRETLTEQRDRPDVSVVNDMIKRLNPEMIEAIHHYHAGKDFLIRRWEKKLRANINRIQRMLDNPSIDMLVSTKKWSKSMVAYWCECLLVLAWMRRKEYYHATIGKNT